MAIATLARRKAQVSITSNNFCRLMISRSMRPRLTCSFVAVVVVVLAEAALQAAAAPHGAYVGCFAVADSSSTVFKAETIGEVTDCAATCKNQDYALALISSNAKAAAFTCRCSNVVPAEEAKLDETACEPGKGGFAVFYQHSDAPNTLCRVMNPPMSAFVPVYGNEHLNTSDDGTLRIELKKDRTMGTMIGARLETKENYLYGMFQLDAKVSGESGVISSFYLRSSRVYPNSKLSDFSEIDWEFCNGKPCEPNTIHTNSYTKAQSNGEDSFVPSEYQDILGAGVLSSTQFVTYSIHWQHDSLAWYANGRLMKILRHGDIVQLPEWEGSVKKRFVSPYRACHQVLSMWTDDRNVPENSKFGGNLDLAKAPFYTYFRQLRRIVCDKRYPCGTNAAAAALGPAWLYGGDAKAVILASRSGKNDTELACSDEPVVTSEDPESPSSNFTGPSWLPVASLYPVNDPQLLAGSGVSVPGDMLGPNGGSAAAAGLYHMLAAVAVLLGVLLL